MTDAISAAPPPPPPAPPPPPPPPSGPLDREPTGGQQQQADLPGWMTDLPDELKADKTLALFKDLPDLAKGVVERQKMLGDRVALPKDDDPDSFLRYAAAVRPESADAYKIELAEGQDPAFADTMRPVFHDAGLLPWQADKLVAANNAYAAKVQGEMEAAGLAELEAVKTEMGKESFEQHKAAAISMLERLGIPAQFDKDMERFIGAGNSLRYFFALAKSAGELGKINDADVQLGMGNLTPAQAYAEAEKMVKADKAGKLKDPGSADRKRYDQLVAAASQKAA